MSEGVITSWCEKCRRLFPLRLVVDTSYIPPKSRVVCEECATAIEKANAERERRLKEGGGPIYGAPFG